MKKNLFISILLLSLHINSLALTLSSSAFKAGGTIPSKYTCDGNDLPPTLVWQKAPPKTQSFVIIMEDPDAPSGVWDHWLVFNIPKTFTKFPVSSSHALVATVLLGKNSWGITRYNGPCPPMGEHRYLFTLYALNTLINLPAGVNKQQLQKAMQTHILEQTTLTAKYKREK